MRAKSSENLRFRALWQVAGIILLAAASGFVANQLRSKGLPLTADWSTEVRLTDESGQTVVISLDEAREAFFSDKALFLDARSPDLYKKGHIQGAKNLPWQSFDDFFDAVMKDIPQDAFIVAYCDGENCSLSEDLAKDLLFVGYENVRVLVNGWTRWVEAGLPLEREVKGHSDGRKG